LPRPVRQPHRVRMSAATLVEHEGDTIHEH
jgi:hypothetical protein